MQFFDSFFSLGYSAINIVLIFTVVMAIVFRSLGLHKRPVKTQLLAVAALMVVAAVPFVMTVNFLAGENKRLNDAVRQEGGIKQNFPKN